MDDALEALMEQGKSDVFRGEPSGLGLGLGLYFTYFDIVVVLCLSQDGFITAL